MTRADRRIWTPDEWSSFTSRCRAARDELHSLIEDFPPTNGITAKIIDASDTAYVQVTIE